MELVEREDVGGGVRVLALNRPDRRNALSAELIEALIAALSGAEGDESVVAVVLTGRGRSFCAGGDLAGGMAGAGGVLESHQRRAGFGRALMGIAELRVPVIAALNGDALGGGCGLAAACDLVVADATARLGTPEIRLGLFPWVILAVLQRNVARKHLMELVLTGEKIDASRAQQIGLVNRVSEEGKALEHAIELAQHVASRSPAVLALGKAAFHRIADMHFDEALDYMNTQLTLNLLTEDAMEGVAAFLQKRDPVWKGR